MRADCCLTAPAAYTIVPQSIRIVKVHLFRQNIEPNIKVFPKENRRRNRLLLDFYGLCIIFDTVILAPAHRLRFSYSIKGQNLLIAVQAVYDSGNGTSLKHGTAPTHHSRWWANVFTNIVENLFSIFATWKIARGWFSLYLVAYSIVDGNSNVVSPKMWTKLGLPRVLMTISAVAVESLPQKTTARYVPHHIFLLLS